MKKIYRPHSTSHRTKGNYFACTNKIQHLYSIYKSIHQERMERDQRSREFYASDKTMQLQISNSIIDKQTILARNNTPKK